MNSIKQALFKIFGLNRYLSILQKSYIASYTLGMLKSNKTYAWHHFVKKLIKEDDVIIDIGANLGYFTFIFKNLINDKGHLYCVEPVETYRLQLNKITNNSKNITVLPFALGNENLDSVTLGMPAAFANLGYLKHGVVTVETTERAVAGDFTFSSPLKKGSEVFAKLGKIDYIKCDIEGYETVVLQEMKALLQKHEPMVQLETWGEQLPVMLNYFSSIGFEAFNLENGKLIDCKTLELNQINTSDVFFVAPSKFERIKDFI